MPSKIVTLVSCDHKEFKVDAEVAKMSKVVANMFEPDDDDALTIPILRVQGEILEKVIEFCQHHAGDKPEEDEEKKEEGASEANIDDPWDQEFVKVEQGVLFELILAANYMDIKPLMDLSCKTVANMIKGKSTEQLREMFNIENDFTEEEDAQLKEENAAFSDKL